MKDKLTQKKLDSFWEKLSKDGGGVYVDPKAPRFETRNVKITKARAEQIKHDRIASLQLEIKELQALVRMARKAPLQTHEQKYVELRRGSKAWKKHGAPILFPLIISKECSDKLLEHKKPKQRSQTPVPATR